MAKNNGPKISHQVKGEVRQKKLSAQSFYPTLTKFQKAILTEKPRSRSKIKLKGPKLTK